MAAGVLTGLGQAKRQAAKGIILGDCIRYLTLLGICVLSVSIRLFSVAKYGKAKLGSCIASCTASCCIHAAHSQAPSEFAQSRSSTSLTHTSSGLFDTECTVLPLLA